MRFAESKTKQKDRKNTQILMQIHCFLSAFLSADSMLQLIVEEESSVFQQYPFYIFYRQGKDLFSVSSFKTWHVRGTSFLLSGCKSKYSILHIPTIYAEFHDVILLDSPVY